VRPWIRSASGWVSNSPLPATRWAPLPRGGAGKRAFQCFDCDGPDPIKTDKVTGWLKGELRPAKQGPLIRWSTGGLGLVNKHYRRSLFDVRAEQDGIPIRQPDAPVGFGFADFGRIGRAVETISLGR